MYQYRYQKHLTDAKGKTHQIYGENIPDLPNKHIYKLLLRNFNSFAQEHGLSYIIAFGTLLGQVRNEDFIPYDYDIDVIISRSTIKKLYGLIKSQTSIPIIYNSDLVHKPLRYTGKPVLILNSNHPNESRGQRYSCDGTKVYRPKDGCSFQSLMGRLVYMDNKGKTFYLDLFGYFNFKYDYGNSKSDHCRDFNFPIVPCKLAGVDTYCPETKKSHTILSNKYGANYMRPDHKYNHRSKRWEKI